MVRVTFLWKPLVSELLLLLDATKTEVYEGGDERTNFIGWLESGTRVVTMDAFYCGCYAPSQLVQMNLNPYLELPALRICGLKRA